MNKCGIFKEQNIILQEKNYYMCNHMENLTDIMLRQYIRHKRIHTDDSVYMKFKNRQNHSLVMVMVMVAVAGEWVGIDWEGTLSG